VASEALEAFVTSRAVPSFAHSAPAGWAIFEFTLFQMRHDRIQVVIKKFPDYKVDPQGYVEAAKTVPTSFADSGLSLAIPTWAYSDEPTGQFSSAIGKYFSNSIREDGLLAIAAWGVIFAPGSSSTLQEVFQDVAHNSYWTFGSRGPMVFYSSSYTDKPSIFDVVKARADKDGYGDMVGVCSTVDEVVQFILTHPMKPESPAAPKRTFGISNSLLHL
jgi:hypothetical protein